LAAYPELCGVVEETMNALLPAALGVIGETFATYDSVPFGLVESEFIDYALAQLAKRVERLEKARGVSLEEIERVTRTVIEQEDA